MHILFPAEEMFNSLDFVATGIEEAYVIGQGLSEVGAKLLGEKLANMTIGDIETLLDFKDIDPILVAQLMKDMRDLAKALVCLLLYLPNRNKFSTVSDNFFELFLV